ncbi:GPI-c transferase complex [Phlyctema vagabunda]|uniref:GPI-c transferase complex n=1 Tax=Phlyctema vagabunda TaxID=108571 RepID=A0ABR4PXR7_9HELO
MVLTSSPHLRTRRPSPTTVEYIVSTSPAPTITVQVLLGLSILVRITLGLSCLLLVHSTWVLSPLSSPVPGFSHASASQDPVPRPDLFTNEFIWYAISYVHNSRVGVLSTRLADAIPPFILLPAAAVVLYGILRRMHTRESLLVLRGLGVQTSTSSGTYLSTATTRFIPTEKIQDVLVNEAFRGFEVRYYLVIVVEGEEEVVVVFPKLLPRRQIVETVWRGVRECLYEPENGKQRG